MKKIIITIAGSGVTAQVDDDFNTDQEDQLAKVLCLAIAAVAQNPQKDQTIDLPKWRAALSKGLRESVVGH